MANPLSGNPICRRCEHRRAQDIQDCAGSNQHCAYQFSKAPLLAWRIRIAKQQTIGWLGCVLLLLVSALLVGLFASDVTDPDPYLVMLASQSKPQLSLSERTQYRTAIKQRVITQSQGLYESASAIIASS